MKNESFEVLSQPVQKLSSNGVPIEGSGNRLPVSPTHEPLVSKETLVYGAVLFAIFATIITTLLGDLS